MVSELVGPKLTKAQRAMLEECLKASRFGQGVVMFDRYQERVAQNLADKGYVYLPAGFKFVFGGRDGVKITDAGRAALEAKP